MERQLNHIVVSAPPPPYPAPAEASIEAKFIPDGVGGGSLRLQYHGPLVTYDPIWVRLGERRMGKDWLQMRDVQMTRVGERATATISIASGSPLEGLTFAFFALPAPSGAHRHEIWDNAGRPYGSYLFDPRTGSIAGR